VRRVLLLLLFAAAPAYAKSLHWNAIDVHARLDRDGNLHVTERQELVFDGDWNGGERDFNLRPNQDVELHRITRIDEDKRRIELTEGSLDDVDRWEWASTGVVRWRSRLASDPPFANTAITYVLEYTYSGILVPVEGKRFLLDHDFGLPDRTGAVGRFRLQLALDPIWGAGERIAIERENLQPQEQAVVERQLTYAGDWPSSVDKPLSPLVPIAAMLLFVIAVGALVFRFVSAERATGRFEPVRTHFDEALLKLDPEVAGAVWDAGVGAPEVAAVLARMTQEKKLATRTEDGTLHMTLKVPRKSLQGYERELVSKLFFDGTNETDTDLVRAHYSRTGFNPAAIIREPLELKLEKLAHWKKKETRFNLAFDVTLVVVAFLLLAGSAFASELDMLAALAGFVGGGLFAMIAGFLASQSSSAIDRLGVAFGGPGLLMSIAWLPFLVAAALAMPVGLHAPVLFALLAWTLALTNLVLDLLKIRDTREKIAYRKRIAGARRWFAEQLRSPDPQLKDEWFPYALAFGLGSEVDRWFRAFGGESRDSSSASSFSSSSSSSSSSSWTGGGGAFGGAGASGSWAIAASAMASGVSSPSSSSSSSSGGGGSSSGGGGGGGW